MSPLIVVIIKVKVVLRHLSVSQYIQSLLKQRHLLKMTKKFIISNSL